MAETQAEAAVRLEQLGGKLDKISAETTSLVEGTRDLKTLVADLQTKVGNVDPAITAAIDKLLGQATSIDNKVDDLAPSPTPTPPGDTGTPPTGDGGAATGDAGGTTTPTP